MKTPDIPQDGLLDQARLSVRAAMQPEREAAEKLRIVADALVHAPLREHLCIQFPELAKARIELIQALAAYEAAKGK